MYGKRPREAKRFAPGQAAPALPGGLQAGSGPILPQGAKARGAGLSRGVAAAGPGWVAGRGIAPEACQTSVWQARNRLLWSVRRSAARQAAVRVAPGTGGPVRTGLHRRSCAKLPFSARMRRWAGCDPTNAGVLRWSRRGSPRCKTRSSSRCTRARHGSGIKRLQPLIDQAAQLPQTGCVWEWG